MEELAQEVAPDVDVPELPEVDAPVDAPEVPEVAPVEPEVTPAAPVKRPRGRPRKNPEEPKRPRGRPRKTPEKEVRFEEAVPEVVPVPEPSSIPDAVYVLAQVLLQNEAEARRRKAERYKNMLGLYKERGRRPKPRPKPRR